VTTLKVTAETSNCATLNVTEAKGAFNYGDSIWIDGLSLRAPRGEVTDGLLIFGSSGKSVQSGPDVVVAGNTFDLYAGCPSFPPATSA
jgi:hypothetical protein